MSIINGEVVLDYGPIGDPMSPDPFQFAQARMPHGWHVEGQVVTVQGYRGLGSPSLDQPITWRATATTKCGDRVHAIGYTPGLALANLVVKVPRTA